jgi:hypothetical protein
MRKLIAITTGLLVGVGCFAQEPPPISQQEAPPIQTSTVASQPQADAKDQTITIPPGTKIPVSLTTAIRIKSSHRGDIIRAVTAFPVTVGTQLAIPAGTFVEGTVEKLPKWNSAQQTPPQVNFTQIIFSNGYTVTMNAELTQARANVPDDSYAVAETSQDNYAIGGPLDLQQEPGVPQLPPLPKPHIGAAIGIAAGAAAVGIFVTILAIHHHGSYDAVLYDAGSQFDVVLQIPVTLDAARVAAAINPVQ